MNQDTALMRAIRTAIQVIVGIVLVVWHVPGVPDAIYTYLKDHSVASVPLVSAVVAFVWNFARKDVKNI